MFRVRSASLVLTTRNIATPTPTRPTTTTVTTTTATKDDGEDDTDDDDDDGDDEHDDDDDVKHDDDAITSPNSFIHCFLYKDDVTDSPRTATTKPTMANNNLVFQMLKETVKWKS